MHTRLTAKLFHTVVVLGVGMASTGCAADTEPTPPTSSSSSGTPTTGTQKVATNDAGTTPAKGTSSSSSSGDAFPGWMCCG